jgi:hypothetical protein
MQDHAITNEEQGGGRIASELPADLVARIMLADVLVLIGSSEENDQALKVQTILPGGLFQPTLIASHAYANALNVEHPNILARVRGEPTDAQRFEALRAFACLAGTDNERFEKINAGLQSFEEAEGLADEATTRTPDDFNRIADFVIQALIETEPAEQAPDQEGLEAPAPRIILPN